MIKSGWSSGKETVLRPREEELGNGRREDDHAVDRMRPRWKRQLGWLEIYANKVMAWIEVEVEVDGKGWISGRGF